MPQGGQAFFLGAMGSQCMSLRGAARSNTLMAIVVEAMNDHPA